MTRLINLLLALLLITMTAASAHKSPPIRNWQQGTLRDLRVQKDITGYNYVNNTNASTNRTYTNTNVISTGSAQPNYRTYVTVRIDDDERSYIAEQDLHFPWSKAPTLMVNTPVRYALDRGKLIVVDNDGKEHAMKIVQQFANNRSSYPQQRY